MLSKTKKVFTTHLPVLCSVASSRSILSVQWRIGRLSLLFVPPTWRRNGDSYERKSPLTKRTGGSQKGEPVPKKSGGILFKRNRLEAYRFLDQYQSEFGVRWLLRRLKIYPNAYYNYRKHRKAGYCAQKAKIQKKIEEIYHKHSGVDGYRSMAAYLEREG